MRTTTDVLIVGAGPVGLMLAGELQRRGVDYILVEREREPVPFCKALGVTPRTLEIWDQIGVLEHALRSGRFIAGFMALVEGRAATEERVALGSMPYGFLTISQFDTEAILRSHLQRHGGRSQSGWALVSFEAPDRSVRARLAGPDRTESLVECRYLVGCDGAHSTVRKGAGLEFAGDSYPMTFMLGDVRLHWSLPRGWGYRSPHVVDGELRNTLVCIPVPGDRERYRLSMAAPLAYWDDGADLSTPPSLALLTETMAPMVASGTTISDLHWSSFYRISHRIAPRCSTGPIFIAGDAAHIHPPVGGQGMNTGLQDAFNLGWKLALAVQGRAGADLLDSYDAERRPIGLDVVNRTTHRMDEAITNQGDVKFDQWMQDSQLLVSYRGTRWVAEDVAQSAMAGGPRPGDRAREATGLRRKWVSQPTRLTELLRHPGHTLVIYFGPETTEAHYQQATVLADALRSRHGEALSIYGVAAAGAQILDLERLAVRVDADGTFKASYDPTPAALYLFRPDGHVGYRSDRIDRERLEAYLQQIFGERPGMIPPGGTKRA